MGVELEKCLSFPLTVWFHCNLQCGMAWGKRSYSFNRNWDDMIEKKCICNKHVELQMDKRGMFIMYLYMYLHTYWTVCIIWLYSCMYDFIHTNSHKWFSVQNWQVLLMDLIVQNTTDGKEKAAQNWVQFRDWNKGNGRMRKLSFRFNSFEFLYCSAWLTLRERFYFNQISVRYVAYLALWQLQSTRLIEDEKVWNVL